MSQLTQALQHAAARNRELLATLAQTDHSSAALAQTVAFISDLEKQIKTTQQQLRVLHRTTEDERKDHLSYRDSTFKRYAHKLGGKKGAAKFDTRREKEEREFMEAWQKEREGEERLEELKHALNTAAAEKPRLENDKARHESAQQELDAMYFSIFSGPTPEVPGEDQMEQTVQQAKQWFEQCQYNFNTEKAAGEALRRVEQRLKVANMNINNALDSSRMDMFGVGGTFADMMERDALSQAQVAISESLRHMDEARRLQPQINALRDIHIDNGHMMGDIFFDNIFSDMQQHERIKASSSQLAAAQTQLQTEIRCQLDRAEGAKAQLNQAKENVEGARTELQSIRAEAFERLAGGSGYGYEGANMGIADAPPPAYSDVWQSQPAGGPVY